MAVGIDCVECLPPVLPGVSPPVLHEGDGRKLTSPTATSPTFPLPSALRSWTVDDHVCLVETRRPLEILPALLASVDCFQPDRMEYRGTQW